MNLVNTPQLLIKIKNLKNRHPTSIQIILLIIMISLQKKSLNQKRIRTYKIMIMMRKVMSQKVVAVAALVKVGNNNL